MSFQRSSAIFTDHIFRRATSGIRSVATRLSRKRAAAPIERLEPRTLLSISATGQLNLVSTTGTVDNPVYHYDITVTDTGTTNIGTFWFGWVPGEDFLPSTPLSESSPTGWGATVTGGGLYDGSAIEWVASSHLITPGNSLSGFAFTSPDSPLSLASISPFYHANNAMDSFVYAGGPEIGVGDQFTVAPAVTQAASTTTVTPSQATINHGDPVTFTATVTGSGATPTGTVTFFQNGNSLGSSPLVSGAATLMTSTLPSGALSITAQYGGDSNFTGSTSLAITETVNPPPATTTTLMTSNPSVVSGTSVTFTAKVAPVTPTGTQPTGTVTFTQDGNSLGTFPVLGDGTAQVVTSTLPIGTDSITASYSGDSKFSASTSSVTSETISAGAQATATSLISSAPSLHTGDSITFTATVAAVTPGGAAPTGTVSFSQDGNPLGTAPVTGDGTAALASTALPLGSDTVIATYGGDANYSGSASTAVSENVTAPPALVPTIASSQLPDALVAGAAAHGAITLDISNTTADATNGKLTLELFASTDGSIDDSAIPLGHVVRKLKVKTTQATTTKLPFKITPSALPEGSYTLLTRVIDAANTNSDSSTGPALTVAAPFIALSETFARTTIPSTAASGAKAHAVAVLRITNNGNITTTNTTTVALFASLSGVVDGSATLIKSVTKPLRIRPGKAASVSIPVKQIPAVAAGAYTIVAQVTDSNGQITTVVGGVVNIT